VSKRKLRVTVNNRHVAAGRRADCGGCPVALALSELMPGSRPFVAGCRTLSLRAGNATEWLLLPEDVADWLCRFDCGWSQETIAFDLELPTRLAEHYRLK
jgi:hypothetical protein